MSGLGNSSFNMHIGRTGAVSTPRNGVKTFTNRVNIDGGVGTDSTGMLVVKQNGDSFDNGIALTSSNINDHRLWKNRAGVLNIGP